MNLALFRMQACYGFGGGIIGGERWSLALFCEPDDAGRFYVVKKRVETRLGRRRSCCYYVYVSGGGTILLLLRFDTFRRVR